VLAMKISGCPEFTVLNIYFLSFRIFEQLTLVLKNRVAQKCFAVWNILFTFRIFEQFACACPEKQSCHSGFLKN